MVYLQLVVDGNGVALKVQKLEAKKGQKEVEIVEESICRNVQDCGLSGADVLESKKSNQNPCHITTHPILSKITWHGSPTKCPHILLYVCQPSHGLPGVEELKTKGGLDDRRTSN